MSLIERDYAHWVCPTCDSVDGPVDGLVCVICREESVNSEVEGLVPASQHRGAVDSWPSARVVLQAVIDGQLAPVALREVIDVLDHHLGGQ